MISALGLHSALTNLQAHFFENSLHLFEALCGSLGESISPIKMDASLWQTEPVQTICQLHTIVRIGEFFHESLQFPLRRPCDRSIDFRRRFSVNHHLCEVDSRLAPI